MTAIEARRPPRSIYEAGGANQLATVTNPISIRTQLDALRPFDHLRKVSCELRRLAVRSRGDSLLR
jgi:hypothetical protein